MQTNVDNLSGGSEPQRKKKSKQLSPEQMVEARIINNLIKETLQAVAQENHAKLYKEDCAHAVMAVLAEFLQSYILIGYDFDGTPIKIVNAHSGMEADALLSALQKFMINIHTGDGNIR